MRISLLFCSLSVKLFSDGAAIIVDFTAISASGVCMYVAYLHASHKILSEVANLQPLLHMLLWRGPPPRRQCNTLRTSAPSCVDGAVHFY